MLKNDLVVLASVWRKLSFRTKEIISKSLAGESNQSTIETCIETIITLDESLDELNI